MKKTGMRVARSVTLEHVIGVLVGSRKSDFAYEPALRLFQFKYWLFDSRNQKEAFTDAGLIFCSLAIEMEAAKLRKRVASGFEIMLLSISQPRLRRLINATFGRNYSLGRLLQVFLLPRNDKIVDDISEELRILNAITKFRLRLSQSKSEPSMNNASALLSNSTLEEKCSETKSKEIERRRRERSAFMFVATEFDASLSLATLIDYESDAIVTEIEKNVASRKKFKDYFARVKHLLPIIDSELLGKLDSAWPDIDPIALPELEPISEDELFAAGVSKPMRRSATETTVARRQKAGGKI